MFDGKVGTAANTQLKSFSTFASLAKPNAAVHTAAVDVDGNGQVDRFLQTQGDPGGPAGISNVSVAGVRSATPVTSLVGPLRIAAARTVFQTQTINGTVATPSPTAGVAAGASRPMQIREIVTGSGATATVGQSLTVKYTGMLTDGTVFDASQITLTLGAGQVINGWEAGLAGMQVGGRRLLVIPPELAYGDAARTGIPAKSTLVFDVELVSATSPATVGGTATGALTAGVGAMTASGTLTVTDPDAGQGKFATPATAALNGTYGAFTFNPDTGAWGYTLDTNRPATLLLRAPTVVTDSLAVTSIDGSASRTIEVSITGFTLQTMNAIVSTPSPTAGISAGASRPMQYADIVTGTGATATNGKSLSVRYTGLLTNGTVFDSGTLPNPPSFPSLVLGAGSLISGFESGLVGMKVGGQRLLVIPPELAYGDTARTGIPAGSTLVFKVELLSAT